MDPSVRVRIQQHLDNNIPPYTSPAGSGREGGLVGSVVPATPEKFVQDIRDDLVEFKYNGWALDKAETEAMIAMADEIYRAYYADWVRIDLAGDAPPDVVAWQAAARAAA